MQTYYDERGNRLGQAWSAMRCSQARDHQTHQPHVHAPEYTMYGPYMCEGWPKIALYLTKERKPVN